LVETDSGQAGGGPRIFIEMPFELMRTILF
jgi:hypothetical protein